LTHVSALVFPLYVARRLPLRFAQLMMRTVAA
jgi:hypothetical protein